MPALFIGGRPYRGFYDVRVVRMAGREFTTEEMLRVRRRTLWMGAVYSLIVERAHRGETVVIQGFGPGEYLDMATTDVHSAPVGCTQNASTGKPHDLGSPQHKLTA